MKTIYAGLPFYNGFTVDENTTVNDFISREYLRVHSKIPFYTPTTHLPPFLICDVIANVPSTVIMLLIKYNELSGDEISSFLSTPLKIISFDDYFYIVHDGATLTSPLTPGVYSLIIQDNHSDRFYYSELFAVVDMTLGNWCKIECSNTNDVGDILYATGGFESVYYLNTQLGYPATETVEVGEEKDGEFITEKLVTKYMYRISDYIGRALQRCLLRLPQHDSITITDDIGNTYTPAVGNVQITSEWPAFDVCHIVIQFNDGENTAFKWTYDMANIT